MHIVTSSLHMLGTPNINTSSIPGLPLSALAPLIKQAGPLSKLLFSPFLSCLLSLILYQYTHLIHHGQGWYVIRPFCLSFADSLLVVLGAAGGIGQVCPPTSFILPRVSYEPQLIDPLASLPLAEGFPSRG